MSNKLPLSCGPILAIFPLMISRTIRKEPWMRIVEEEKKPSVSVEELLDLLQTKKEKEARRPERERPFLKGLPMATIILVLLIVAMGVMVIILKSDIAILKNDITDLKNLKTQVATLDPKLQITTLEGKLEDMKKEKEVMKGEMAQIKGEMEALKAERKKGKK
jgi:hypothetical protein